MMHSVPIAAVIFDLDGTLTKPYLNFDDIRAELGVEGPVLEAIERLDAEERARAERVIRAHELRAAKNAELQDGAEETLAACRSMGLRTAILTRNARATVRIVMERFGLSVDALRTREDGAIKPSPEPVRSICRELQADPGQSWVVGDYLFDIRSGRDAGSHTALMVGDGPLPDFAGEAHYVIRRLAELIPLIKRVRYVDLPAGSARRDA